MNTRLRFISELRNAHMLLYDNQIYLARNEIRRITLLTGETPQGKMAIEIYYKFLDRHLTRF